MAIAPVYRKMLIHNALKITEIAVCALPFHGPGDAVQVDCTLFPPDSENFNAS